MRKLKTSTLRESHSLDDDRRAFAYSSFLERHSRPGSDELDVINVGSRMIDSFGRRISYVRLSVTDRCDLRCRYCMAERMSFAPRKELLDIHELVELSDILIDRGVTKIRLTGGEPLVRKDIDILIAQLGRRLGHGLDELTLTTNGTQLERFASLLHGSGVRRVNVSLDTLDPDRFRHITRGGDIDKVLRGLASAAAAGLRVKINMVALKDFNEDEFGPMLLWCAERGFGLTLIETMPLGEVEEDRTAHYLPLDQIRERLDREFGLTRSPATSGGPARYYEVEQLGARIGFITPLTENFCDGCNRIRITATGTVFGCLGHDQKVELRELLRNGSREAVNTALDLLLAGKVRRHEFRIAAPEPAVSRHMSVTGG